MSERYALYFTPAPGSALETFGAAWLGEKPGDSDLQYAALRDGFSPERLQEITASAQHYGFHATLKAPFALAEGCTPQQLNNAIAAFVETRRPIADLSLKIAGLDNFLALVPAKRSDALQNLAADCVRAFDSFRASSSEQELAHRRQAKLSELQDALLQRWGYPYVMEAFRFHMTLTCRLEAAEFTKLEALLRTGFASLADDRVALDAISLCHQETRKSPFRLVRRYPLADAASASTSTKAETDRESGPSLTTVTTSSPST